MALPALYDRDFPLRPVDSDVYFNGRSKPIVSCETPEMASEIALRLNHSNEISTAPRLELFRVTCERDWSLRRDQ